MFSTTIIFTGKVKATISKYISQYFYQDQHILKNHVLVTHNSVLITIGNFKLPNE